LSPAGWWKQAADKPPERSSEETGPLHQEDATTHLAIIGMPPRPSERTEGGRRSTR
jgi:hypothetical protein